MLMCGPTKALLTTPILRTPPAVAATLVYQMRAQEPGFRISTIDDDEDEFFDIYPSIFV